jgi:hypothetical protein
MPQAIEFPSRVRIGESSESFDFLNLATSQLSTLNSCFIISLLLFSINKYHPSKRQHKSPLLLHSSSVQLFANSQVILSLLERAKIAVKRHRREGGVAASSTCPKRGGGASPQR